MLTKSSARPSRENCGSHFAGLLDRRHRVWSSDHLLWPALLLVFLVLRWCQARGFYAEDSARNKERHT